METTQNLFGFEQIEASTESNSTLIIEEIRKEVQGYLLEESDNTDSTDRVFDFLSTLYQHYMKKFRRNFTNCLTETAIRNVFLEH